MQYFSKAIVITLQKDIKLQTKMVKRKEAKGENIGRYERSEQNMLGG